MNSSLWHDPALIGIELHRAKSIGDNCALNRLCRMACPPANDVTAQIPLGENIPKRFALARCACVRPRAAVHRVRLDKPVATVFVSKLTGCNRIPQHGGQNRLPSCEVTHDPPVNDSIEGWH